MFREVFTLMTILLVLVVSNLQAGQIQSTWTGYGDGSSWGDPSNWNPVIVPDNDDTNTFIVTVDGSGNIRLQQNRTVDQLTCYNTVQFLIWPLSGILLTADQITNFGTLNFDDKFWFAGDVANYGQMWVEADAEIKGNLTNNNFIKVSGGVEISGTFTNKMGAEAYLPNDIYGLYIGGNLKNDPNASIVSKGSIDVEGTLENAGQIEVKASHGFISIGQDFHNTGKVSLYGANFDVFDVFDNNSTGDVKGYGRIISQQPIQNNGVIRADGGVLTLRSYLSLKNTGSIINKPSSILHIKVEEYFKNEGLLQVNAGGGIASDCNLTNEPNAVIRLLGGSLASDTITQSTEATFEGFGGLTGDLVINENGVIDINGPTNIIGDVNIEPHATLEIRDGTTLIRGHTTCNNGTIHMIGGRVICQGGLTNNCCNIVWEPGLYTTMADFNLDGKVNFEDFAFFADSWLWKAKL